MPNDKEIYKVTHSSPELSTVGDYLFEKNSPAFLYQNTPEKFLNIKDENGITNRQRIEATYKTPEEKQYIGKDADNLPLKVGTILYLEYDKINESSFVTEGIEVVSTDDVAFKAAKLAELESDTRYFPVNKPVKGQLQNGNSKEVYPDISVWCWCRAISPKVEEEGQLTGEFFDLTPFVQNVTTNMGKNGGNFQLSLPPLVCELNEDRQWVLKKDSLIQYSSNAGDEYVAESSLFSMGKDETLVANKFLFHNIISANDLIFIRFETLHIEKEQRYKDSKEYYIDKKNIANRIYDMIGLVDDNIQTITPENNDVSIRITGRDLSKLFIDDGTYFYGLENSQGLLKFAGQSTQKNSQISRIFGDGAMNFIGLYNFTSIEYIFKFIINQLSNIEITPKDLFSSYAYSKKKVDGVVKEYDSRNYRYNEDELYFNKKDIKDKTKYTPKYHKELANGIWQIVKLVIDKSVSERRLADSSFSTAQGSLLNFFRSAAQEPLVEFYMDTYGDKYHLIVRKPPYDQKALLSLIEGRVKTEEGETTTPPAIIDIEQEDVLKEMLKMDDSQVYSWYHFFPRNDLIGDASNYSLAYIGALYFEEYAQIYGAKPFQQTHPYVPFIPKNRKEGSSLDINEKQAVTDLTYVVESNQYLPFTRKGTLVVNRDRRIKIGNVIRYKPTGEIFFVDSVQQSHTINENTVDATTTIQVSRGMIEQLIYGVHYTNENGVTRFVSYYNLIDTRLEFNYKPIDSPVTTIKQVGTKQVAQDMYSLQAPVSLTEPAFNVHSLLVSDSQITQPNLVIGISQLEDYNKAPEFKKVFVRFINAVNNAGYKVEITSGYRSEAKQAILKVLNKHNAKAGHSKHERGAAIDINIINVKTGKRYWSKSTELEWRSTGVPSIANEYGLRWAGNNDGTFGVKGTGNYWADRVHFEVIGTGSVQMITVADYQEVTENKKVMGLDREGLFKNFKVNKFTFNFFLKKLQFDPELRVVTNRNVYNSDKEGSSLGVTVKSVRHAGK